MSSAAQDRCACGGPLVACEKCGDSRCLVCDPYDASDICSAATTVAHEVAAVMKALAPMGGTPEQSDACIALGRLAAWAEAGLTPHYGIEVSAPLTLTPGQRKTLRDAK